jgi:hypothetical protein
MPRSLLVLVAFLSFVPSAYAQAPAAAPALPPNASAVGDLLVTPTRLILEGNRRTTEITLVNLGVAPATYRISLLHLRMKTDGSMEEFDAATPQDRVADSLLRYSPRQVTLEPRVAQVVRIQVRKPADLAPGEYRSHLLFRGVPKADEAAPTPEQEAQGVSIRLIPIYGVSIPLIVRHGETSATAQLRNLELVPGEPGRAQFFIRATMLREGNRSVYGNFRVTLARNGRDTVIGAVDGVAVYDGVGSRSVLIPLNPEKDVRLNGSRVRVAYYDAEQEDGEGRLLAEAFLDIP